MILQVDPAPAAGFPVAAGALLRGTDAGYKYQAASKTALKGHAAVLLLHVPDSLDFVRSNQS